MKTRTKVANNTNVEIAFISGEIPNRIIEYILTGKVSLPTPEEKNVIRKSSNERVNESSAPLVIAGSKSGNVT